MFLPPYNILSTHLEYAARAKPPESLTVVPKAFLRLLIQVALSRMPFDEESYLQANPDVAQAIRAGKVESGRVHFVGTGYFEGRQGGVRDVDAVWYLKTYPDVAKALKDGTTEVSSAQQHYLANGALEGRVPYSDAQVDVAELRYALGL